MLPTTKFPLLAIVLLLVMCPLTVVADDKADEIAIVREKIESHLPDMDIESIRASQVPGFYEVVVDVEVIYVSADGRYLFKGDMIDLDTRQNLSAPAIAKARAQAIEAVGEENMLIFEGKEVKHTVTIFTDVDCSLCRQMHKHMDEYTARGIRIRYLLYPGAGLDSPSYNKAVSVWCAADRKKAMNLYKSGKELEERDCDNPVFDHYDLGQRMGVVGTPTMVLEDGEMMRGYMLPEKLRSYLESKQ